jgi:hypothetical protein
MQTFIEWPDYITGLPQRQQVDGTPEDFEVKPWKGFSWSPNDWVCVTLKGVGNMYEGPGPARVFQE